MQGFFSILSDEVRRFEGTVDKFTGDGIMAVFGAPVAHEDHAQRACLAALRMLDDIAGYAGELRRKHGLNFSARIGINSGEVIAGAIGPGGDGEYTAIGHTVGLAQRMEALAEPGKAYLTEATAELARGFLELEDLGEFEIKGASRPVRVFELAGRRDGALAARPLARARLLALRRPRRGDGDAGGGPGAGAPGRGRGGRDRRRTGRRQEPPLPRVRRAHARRRDRGLRGAGAVARPRDPLHAGAADAARLLRDRRRRRRARRAREGRRPGAAARPRVRRGAAGALRLPRRPRPGAAGAAAQRRGAAAGAEDDRLPTGQRAEAARAGRRRARGPALAGRGQRGDARRAVRRDRGHADAGRRQLPARIRDAPGPARPTTTRSHWRRSGRPTRRSCCAIWPARTPRSTGWPS